MRDQWVKTPPPEPQRVELRRTIATSPVKAVLCYQESPGPRATAILSMGTNVFLVTEYGDVDDVSGRAVFDALAVVLDHYAVAMRHAASELREGPPPC